MSSLATDLTAYAYIFYAVHYTYQNIGVPIILQRMSFTGAVLGIFLIGAEPGNLVGRKSRSGVQGKSPGRGSGKSLKYVTLNPARGLGELRALFRPYLKSNLVNFSLTIWYLVERILISTPKSRRGTQHRASPLLQKVGDMSSQSTHGPTPTDQSIKTGVRRLDLPAAAPFPCVRE